jgi:hypothetical protein
MAAHRLTGKQSRRSTDTRSLGECHRAAGCERTRDEPPPAPQHARAKQTFVPADPPARLGLFVCGPTVYDLPHLRHAKADSQFDFLARLPRTRGFAVTSVQNITDADDKIIRPARELGIDASDLARIYERAYLEDIRALRNDSVYVYSRASDYIDQVINQIERLQQAGATPSRRAARRRSRLRSLITRAVRRAPACRGRARARSRMPYRSGRTCSGAVADALDVYAGHLHHAASSSRCSSAPSRRAKSPSMPALVGERLDTVHALGAQPPRPDAPVAARVGLAHQPGGTAMCSRENGAAGSAGSRPWGPSGGAREPESRARPRAGHDAGRRMSVTRQVGPHAPPSAARRSSQARSHRRHSSADRRQCSW